MKKIVISIIVGIFLTQLAFAATEDELRTLLLKGDFDAVIQAASSLAPAQNSNAKIYYFCGLAYLKKKNYEQARFYLDQASRHSSDKKLQEKSRISLADTFLLEQKFQEASVLYESLLRENTANGLKPLLLLRAAQCDIKQGKWKEGDRFLDELNRNYPNSLEMQIAESLQSIEYFCVQVGSFSNEENANKFANILKSKGFDTYVIGVNIDKGTIYRVRVGKCESRQEAEELRENLDKFGYKTRIYP